MSKGPRLSDLDVMASTEGAPIPRVYGRARLAGQVIWATKLEEVVTTRTETERRQGRRWRRNDDDHHGLQLLRQFRGRPVRRADRPRRAHLGRRQAARSHRHQPSHLYRQRDAGARCADRRQGRRGAGLSRARLCGVRAAAAGEFRQPHPAAVVRDRPPGRPARTDDARGDADPGHDRVRLRAVRGRAGRRRRQPSRRRTAMSRMPRPTSSPRSTICRRPVPISSASPSWSPGSAPICAPAPAR